MANTICINWPSKTQYSKIKTNNPSTTSLNTSNIFRIYFSAAALKIDIVLDTHSAAQQVTGEPSISQAVATIWPKPNMPQSTKYI